MANKRWRALALLAAAAWANAAMAVEEPKFTQVLRDGDFEVRDYPTLVVAEVTVPGAQKEVANQGFRVLAGYIFGGNQRRQDIAMTAPVAQTQATGEKIAMTAPVAQTQSGEGQWVVRFTMPSQYSLDTLPKPNDARVALRRTPPVRVAVLRFSGLARPATVEAKSRELLASLPAHRLRALGGVTLAQYNPPWVPWFLRRNEVMVDVAQAN